MARSGSPPGLAWVGVLALPMVGVGLIALLLAVIVGPGAPVAGRAVGRAAAGVWDAGRAAGLWLWHLLPGSRPGSRSTARPVRGPAGAVPGPHHGHPIHAAFTVPALVWEIVAAVVVLAVVYYLLRNIPPRLKWRAVPSGGTVDEERSSLFSWRHLFAQMRSALRRRPWRHRPEGPPDPAAAPGGTAAEVGLASVRQVYRRFLATARAAGRGRARSETTRELAARLSAELTPIPAAALKELTFLYDDARYGSARTDASADEVASAGADVVRHALESASTFGEDSELVAEPVQ